MKDVKLSDPIAITMRASEWYWLVGVLEASGIAADETLDKLYAQIMEATT